MGEPILPVARANAMVDFDEPSFEEIRLRLSNRDEEVSREFLLSVVEKLLGEGNVNVDKDEVKLIENTLTGEGDYNEENMRVRLLAQVGIQLGNHGGRSRNRRRTRRRKTRRVNKRRVKR